MEESSLCEYYYWYNKSIYDGKY